MQYCMHVYVIPATGQSLGKSVCWMSFPWLHLQSKLTGNKKKQIRKVKESEKENGNKDAGKVLKT